MTGIIIRHIREDEAWFLKEMLYVALFVPPGEKPFPRSILEEPKFRMSYEHWGQKGDQGLVAVDGDLLVGAAWSRFHTEDNPGYGYLSDDIPELTIAIKQEYQNRGIGKKLLTALIDERRQQGIPGISLSVDKRNIAYQIYLSLGFEVVKAEGNPTMMLRF